MNTKRFGLILAVLLLMGLSCSLPSPNAQAPVDQQVNEPAQVAEGDAPASEDPAPIPTETREPTPTTPPPVTFLGIANGDTVTAEIDPVNGLPFAAFEIDPFVANRRDLPTFALDADGLHVYSITIRQQDSGTVRTVRWTPWHGNGEYVLDLWMFDKFGRTQYQETITVNVTGIPEGTPTLQQRFSQIYQDEFGLAVPAPPFAMFGGRITTSTAEYSRWVSALYLKDRYYVIHIDFSGEMKAYSNALYVEKGGLGVCRPMGNYSILTLLVDHPSADYDIEKLSEEINSTVDEVNQLWADFSTSQGLDVPIMQIQNTLVYIEAAPRPNDFLTIDEVKSLTGYDPKDFNILAEIDLDPGKGPIRQYDQGAGGIAFMHYCEPGGRREDINMALGSSLMGGKLAPLGLYGHEFPHLLGWAHEWPIGDGGSESMHNLWTSMFPYLLYGWTDTDGDGVIEVMDETPYGMTP